MQGCKDRVKGSAWWRDEIKEAVEEKKRHTRKCYRGMYQKMYV